MRNIIVMLICLFLFAGSCFAMNFSEVGKKAANELHKDELRWLKQSPKDRQRMADMRYCRDEVNRKARMQYRLDTTGHVSGGLLKLGIGYWGFKQKTLYGNVTGFLFTLSGTMQILNVRW